MQQDRISISKRGGAGSIEHPSYPFMADQAEAADLSDLVDETLRLLMRGKKLAWLQQAREVLAAQAEENHS